MKTFLDGRVTLHDGDCLSVVRCLADDSIDAVVTDPPYALVSIVKRFGKDGAAPAKSGGATGVYQRASSGFMGKTWDTGETAFAVEFWAEILRVLKPGGHVAAFGGTRSYHRLACAIEDAGFEIRDQLAWCYGTGFPKSHDVSKGIDKSLGATREKVCVAPPSNPEGSLAGSQDSQLPWRLTAIERGYHEVDGNEPATAAARQWKGWGTALKPAVEPVTLARKPLSEKTVAANVLRWGTGAINVDATRVGDEERVNPPAHNVDGSGWGMRPNIAPSAVTGRWPANLCHDGSQEVLDLFPESKSPSSYVRGENIGNGLYAGGIGKKAAGDTAINFGDSGSAARFFFNAGPVKQWPDRDQQTLIANDAESLFTLSSELAVSALRNAVEQSTPRLALNAASYRGQNMSVSAQQFAAIEMLLTETIQSIERRCLRGRLPERLTLSDNLASIAATQSLTGIIMITISLSTSNGFVDVATFNLTETNLEPGVEVSAPRFMYCAKASKADRAGSKHPTVKPIKLMQWLCRLITPPGGTILDPFSGSGTTGVAAIAEGFRPILIEREEEYLADIERRFSESTVAPHATISAEAAE